MTKILTHPWFICGLVILACIFIIFAPAHAAVDPSPPLPKVIDVYNDPGGNVAEYYNGYKKLSKEGAVVRLHGICASACTFILFREYTGLKVCAADENATFMFHKPYTFDDRKQVVKTEEMVRISRAIWAEQLVSYPYDVYTLLKDARIPSPSEGDDQNDMFVVPAVFFVPVCGAAQ